MKNIGYDQIPSECLHGGSCRVCNGPDQEDEMEPSCPNGHSGGVDVHQNDDGSEDYRCTTCGTVWSNRSGKN